MEKVVKNNQELDQLLSENNYVLLKAYTTWCGPCQMLGAELKAVYEECNNDKVVFAAADIDASTEIKIRFDIASVPVLLLLKNNEIVTKVEGFIDKQKILNLINDNCI